MSDRKLNPDAVRLRASSIPGCIEWKVPSTSASSPTIITATANSDSMNDVCSFLVECPEEGAITPSSSPSKSSTLSNSFLMISNPFHSNNNTTASSSFEAPTNRNAAATTTTAVDDGSALARVTIYCKTGTIMTSRILNGCVRNLFRKNVTSLDIVELNPALDLRNQTAELAVDLVESLFGKSTLMRR